MGIWSVLWELARAVVPHAAPHVARAVVDAARERRSAGSSQTSQSENQPSNESLAQAISDLERHIVAAEERSAELEEKLLAVRSEIAERWQYAHKLALGLIAWNAAVTIALMVMVIYALTRK